MLQKSEFLEELIELRNELQLVNNDEHICNDEALVEMVMKKPLKSADFLAISGLDKNFIKKYSKDFLKVINKFRNKDIKEVNVSKKAFKTLNNYKDRLTNISKNNPNLYMGRIKKIKSFDLKNLNDDITLIEFLTNKKIKTYKFNNINEYLHDSLTTLYRNTNKDQKETGAYNLYIAFPYIEGFNKKEKFAIKAPLLYFPVILNRNKKDFSLTKDTDKEIIYNRDLILTISKFNNDKINSNEPNIEEFNLNILNNEIINFYENNGFEINEKINEFDFIKFNNELKEDFVSRKFKDFELKQYITLGRYQPYSSMIQKDMDQIISNQKYNELLEGLIDEANLNKKEKEIVYTTERSKVKEENIAYINQLNDAQETVIDLLNKEKKLVIFGPPGTGKSQTITSLIANAILNKENVLVVSEKKVALDVIYSRLKNASKYAMFIDDPENKIDFYQKLNNLVDPKPPVRTINNDVYTSITEINQILNTLDKSLNLLFNEKDNITINKLFNRYIKNKDINENLIPKNVYELFKYYFKNISFNNIQKLEDTFPSNNKLKDLLKYYEIVLKYPIFNKLETKITRSSIIEFNKFDEEFNTFILDYNTVNFFKKRKIKQEFINKNSLRLSFLTNKKSIDRNYLKLIIKDSTLHVYIKNNINKLDKLKDNFNYLNENEKTFLRMLLNEDLFTNIKDIEKFRKYIFDCYYTGYLEEFKAQNQKYLYIINEYENARLKLNQFINEKIQITNESFEMELYKSALNLANSKRIMDIKRVLEQTKKPSISAFINYFQPELLENVRIWMMTPEVVSHVLPLEYSIFDLVIFDEASQMYVEKGIPAIYRAKKVVIAGDPKQLRPSSLGFGRIIEDDELYEDEILKDVSIDAKSLLDLARYKYKETLLNYHYRSSYEELIAFSNYAFYDSKLIISPNQKISSKPPIEYVYIKDGTFNKRQNHEEAIAVIDLIKKVLKERKNNETIGVITFNSAQRDLIENYLDKELFKGGKYQKLIEEELLRKENNEDKSLFVKNIENVQGDERDIIIFSMGYAKDKTGDIKRRFGWLNHEGGQNRLNVAITRAKEKIYFVTSLYPEEFKVDDLSSYGPKLLKDFMRYCYYISNNKKDLAKLILNELHKPEIDTKNVITNNLIEDVKKRLERLNYQVKTSIGIGEYNINLAIYDELKNEYVLGIICDIENNNNIDSRRDLLHQERYLKSRGWKIYRLFSHNWYIDPNKELRNIRDLLR